MTAQRRTLAAGILIGLSLVFLLGIGTAALCVGRGELEPGTLCRKDRPRAGGTIVLIDVTDPYTANQAQALRARLGRLVQTELRTNEWFAIWVLGDFEEGTLRKPFCACSPGTSSNWLISNPIQTKDRFDSLFAHPLARLLDTLSVVHHAERSPIMEAVQELTEQKEFSPNLGVRRLIIVSDLLQNTARLSQYRARTRSQPSQSPTGDLRGVHVEVLYIERRRDAAYQGSAHRQFWRKYLHRSGATSVDFERL